MPRVQELVIVSAQMPKSLRDKAQKLADKDERTLSYVIRVALREYVAEQEREAA